MPQDPGNTNNNDVQSAQKVSLDSWALVLFTGSAQQAQSDRATHMHMESNTYMRRARGRCNRLALDKLRWSRLKVCFILQGMQSLENNDMSKDSVYVPSVWWYKKSTPRRPPRWRKGQTWTGLILYMFVKKLGYKIVIAWVRFVEIVLVLQRCLKRRNGA